MRGMPMPGCALAVLLREGPDVVEFAGVEALPAGEPVDAGTWWDLASLTKVLVTLPEVLALADDGLLDLQIPLGRQWHRLQDRALGTATPADLLSFRAGLPAWLPFHERAGTPAEALEAVLSTSPLRPPGGKAEYSDIGFAVLGQVVQDLRDQPLSELARRRSGLVFGPIGGHVAATERCGWRGRLLRGEVHDENAAALGGVAGHAGAFGTCTQVVGEVRRWAWDPARHPWRDRATRLWSVGDDGGRYGLGWWLPPTRDLGGSRPGPDSFGASGFTGNRIWVEPARGYAVVVLSNRVHPERGDREPFQRWCSGLLDELGDALGRTLA
jgi:CubicO group peptidase (beta-lactamase class C family)